ncbi:S-crystallin SL11-like [Paramacrobiotus metropolitanus]|uniref:S-crystallin SL11-like n=1 Tax=Paramacrobiotus metropolitanus TaxID=2943436 RepID=UPI002445753C|nr:S-crystallin SL11-like [Paramacrobiotus metropolitanus]
MAKYRLVYFRGRARAELTRLIFHAAGEEFEDVQLDDQSWQQIKTTSPTGSLPMLINNETNEQLVQSMSIARYIARELGLAGSDAYEMALVDSVADTMNDLLGDIVEVTFEDDARRKKERIRRFHERALPETMEFLDRFVGRYGKGSGYAVGQNLTYADLCIYNTADQMVLAGVGGWKDLERYPNIHTIVRRIEETPRFAGYLKSRPPAAF